MKNNTEYSEIFERNIFHVGNKKGHINKERLLKVI